MERQVAESLKNAERRRERACQRGKGEDGGIGENTRHRCLRGHCRIDTATTKHKALEAQTTLTYFNPLSVLPHKTDGMLVETSPRPSNRTRKPPL